MREPFSRTGLRTGTLGRTSLGLRRPLDYAIPPNDAKPLNHVFAAVLLVGAELASALRALRFRRSLPPACQPVGRTARNLLLHVRFKCSAAAFRAFCVPTPFVGKRGNFFSPMPARRAVLSSLILLGLALAATASGQTSPRVFADSKHDVHIVTPDGKTYLIPRETDQVGIEDVKSSTNSQIIGWLVLYPNPDVQNAYAGELVLWRGGRVIRTFKFGQAFYSWSFEDGAKHVAYHVDALHFATRSHCELRDVATGRLLKSWWGDLDDPNKPAWTKHLNH